MKRLRALLLIIILAFSVFSSAACGGSGEDYFDLVIKHENIDNYEFSAEKTIYEDKLKKSSELNNYVVNIENENIRTFKRILDDDNKYFTLNTTSYTYQNDFLFEKKEKMTQVLDPLALNLSKFNYSKSYTFIKGEKVAIFKFNEGELTAVLPNLVDASYKKAACSVRYMFNKDDVLNRIVFSAKLGRFEAIIDYKYVNFSEELKYVFPFKLGEKYIGEGDYLPEFPETNKYVNSKDGVITYKTLDFGYKYTYLKEKDFLICNSTQNIKIYDADTFELVFEKLFDERVGGVATDGNILAIAFQDRRNIDIYNLNTFLLEKTIDTKYDVGEMVLDGTKLTFTTTDWTQQVIMVDINTLEEKNNFYNQFKNPKLVLNKEKHIVYVYEPITIMPKLYYHNSLTGEYISDVLHFEYYYNYSGTLYHDGKYVHFGDLTYLDTEVKKYSDKNLTLNYTNHATFTPYYTMYLSNDYSFVKNTGEKTGFYNVKTRKYDYMFYFAPNSVFDAGNGKFYLIEQNMIEDSYMVIFNSTKIVKNG